MKMFSSKGKNIKSGFTLIEALVFLFIFTTTVFTFYETMTIGMVAMANSKARIGAIKLANEKMEMIRNIDYSNIGIVDGNPEGIIASSEDDVIRGDRHYYINTVVQYVDDDLDGKMEDADSERPDDYKSVRITVFWEKNNIDKSVQLLSLFIPPGIEEVHEGGILKIRVVDFSNQPINGAKVTIINTETGTNFSDFTDNGYIFLTGYKESIQKYQVFVEKSGYYSVHTYDPYPVSPFLPSEVHGTVLDGSYNPMSLITDKLSRLNIYTKDMLGNAIPNLDFSLEGGKNIGSEQESGKSVYSYNKDLSSDSSGKEKIFDTATEETSPGLYSFIFDNDTTTSGYEFVKMDMATIVASDFWLAPDSEIDAVALFAKKDVDSFFATVVGKLDGVPIEGIEVNLKNLSSGYDSKAVTDQFGRVYFPLVEDIVPVLPGTYDVTIDGSVDGYVDFSDTVDIDKLTKKTLELELLP